MARGEVDRPAVGRDRTSGEGDPRIGAGVRRDAQASGVVSPHCQTDKERAGSARFACWAAGTFSSSLRKQGPILRGRHFEKEGQAAACKMIAAGGYGSLLSQGRHLRWCCDLERLNQATINT